MLAFNRPVPAPTDCVQKRSPERNDLGWENAPALALLPLWRDKRGPLLVDIIAQSVKGSMELHGMAINKAVDDPVAHITV